MDTLRARVCAPTPGDLCEGPVWDSRTRELLWVDITRGHIHRADLDRAAVDLVRQRTIDVGPPVGAVLPCASGDLLAAMGDTVFRIAPDGARTPVATLPIPDDGVRRRMNDAKVDPCGRLLVGTMSQDGVAGSAALYRLDPDGGVGVLRTGVTISNGLGWSPDGRTLYYTDSKTLRVDAYEYDPATGTFDNARPFAQFADGEPDGLTVAADGSVWIAVWGAGQVRAFDSDGRARAVVDVGPSQVSSCTFAGPDLDVLMITTAAVDGAAREPDAGRLFACVPGVNGLPATPFADSEAVRVDAQ